MCIKSCNLVNSRSNSIPPASSKEVFLSCCSLERYTFFTYAMIDNLAVLADPFTERTDKTTGRRILPGPPNWVNNVKEARTFPQWSLGTRSKTNRVSGSQRRTNVVSCNGRENICQKLKSNEKNFEGIQQCKANRFRN